MEQTKSLRVILVEPLSEPKVIEIPHTLAALQACVKGDIEKSISFDDEVAIICNDSGKLLGLPPNRAIYKKNGEVHDIIHGPFILCYAPFESEEFLNLPPALEKAYLKRFKAPEQFIETAEGTKVLKSVTSKKEAVR